MADVLSEQVVDADPTAAPEAGARVEATPGEATTDSPGAPDIQAQIDAAVQAEIAKYEGKDGHLSKLKSKKDKEIARLQRQLREQQKGKLEEAKALMESDPGRAAQLLLSQAEDQAARANQESRHQQMVDWQYEILADYGVDPDEDEEAAELVAEWADRMDRNPDEAWGFQQAAGKFVAERAQTESKQTAKELAELKGGMAETINAAVTKALVEQGIIPAPTQEGSEPQKRDEDWRQKPSVSRGLKRRMAEPVIKRG